MEFGLIGEKLSHSYSVLIHNKIADYSYELKEIPKNELQNFILNKNFSGINVTIPYKEAVIPYLDNISDKAKAIGSVNTIVNKNGKLFGYNTDFFGMTALIKHANIDLENKKVLILGTGGTSKTAYSVAKSFNAKEILFVSRSAKGNAISYNDAVTKHLDTEIIINTTPCGMYPCTNASPIDISAFSMLSGVVDMIYNPLSTKLVLDAKARNIKSTGGLYMLVSQAVLASSLFLDKEFIDSETEKIYAKIKSEKQNIVLIGMPSCGKSTIGKILANILGKPFIDIDSEIIKTAKMPITKIFKDFGESKFREIEKRVIASFSKIGGQVIATGGGAVLDSENISLLKQNGVLVFLDRSLNGLVATSDRPLSNNRSDLEKLYNERYPIYKKACDITANANLSPKNIADTIIKEIL